MPEDKTMDMALAKERLRDRKCPYCGADRKDLAYDNVENDGKEVKGSNIRKYLFFTFYDKINIALLLILYIIYHFFY